VGRVEGSMEARSARTVMAFAPFHHPQVFQRPEVLLYHVWRVVRAAWDSARAIDDGEAEVRVVERKKTRRDVKREEGENMVNEK
jgi:hypothetical protein